MQWEQKCLELVAEKQMAFDAAVIPKNVRIASLERSLAEKIDMLHDVQKQKSAYISELTDAKRQVSELDIRLTSAQSSLQEKDSVIQMMQKSFLEPDEDASPSSLTQNYPLNLKTSDKSPSQTTEAASLSLSGVASSVAGSSSQYSVAPSMPQNMLGQSLLLPSYNHANLPVSPVKAQGNPGSRPTVSVPDNPVTSSFLSREPAALNRKDDTAHTRCHRDVHSSFSQHHSGNMLSNSAPNSPKVRNTPHKPRITHSIRLLQAPNKDSPGLEYRQNNLYVASKAELGGQKRSNYQRPPYSRHTKSKTPPPDYHLTSIGIMNSCSKALPPQKQRHKSADNTLRKESENGSSELYYGESAKHESAYKPHCFGDNVAEFHSKGGSERATTEGFAFINPLHIDSGSYNNHHQYSGVSLSSNSTIRS